jgi:hypothetical protein
MTTGKRWNLPASFLTRDALLQHSLHLLWLTVLGALGLLLGWWALSQQPYAGPVVPVDGFLAEEQAPGYSLASFLSDPSLVATSAAPLPLAAGVGSLAVSALTYVLLALAGAGWRRAAAGALLLLAGVLLRLRWREWGSLLVIIGVWESIP